MVRGIQPKEKLYVDDTQKLGLYRLCQQIESKLLRKMVKRCSKVVKNQISTKAATTVTM